MSKWLDDSSTFTPHDDEDLKNGDVFTARSYREAYHGEFNEDLDSVMAAMEVAHLICDRIIDENLPAAINFGNGYHVTESCAGAFFGYIFERLEISRGCVRNLSIINPPADLQRSIAAAFLAARKQAHKWKTHWVSPDTNALSGMI